MYNFVCGATARVEAVASTFEHCDCTVQEIKVSKTFIILYINFTQYHVCLFDLGLSSPEGQGSPKGPRKPKDSHLQLDGSIFNLPPYEPWEPT